MAPPAKKHKTGDMVIVDPNGDLIVHLNEKTVLVSSKILSVASPVFNSMLNGAFKESLKNTSSPDAKHEVSLPDDPCEAFIIMSKVLHFQSSTIEMTTKHSTFLETACLCDKYQCTDAMNPYFEKWASFFRPTPRHSDAYLAELLAITYIADCPGAFKATSETILTVFRRSEHGFIERNSWYALMKHVLIAPDLAMKFEISRENVDRFIDKAFKKLFGKIKKCSCKEGKTRGQILSNLLKLGLMPTNVAKLSIEEIAMHLDMVGYGTLSCIECSTYLYADFDGTFRDLTLQGVGLCLDCIKSDGETGLAKKCRVTHTTTVTRGMKKY